MERKFWCALGSTSQQECVGMTRLDRDNDQELTICMFTNDSLHFRIRNGKGRRAHDSHFRHVHMRTKQSSAQTEITQRV